jgi:uncharacterized membrane protein YGL010W
MSHTTDSACPTFTRVERLLIVPQAHTAILHTQFQLEMYELFHRTAGGRIGHMIGTPTILAGFTILLTVVGGTGWPAAALFAVIALYGVRIDLLAGAATAVGGGSLMALTLAMMPAESGQALLVSAGLIVGGLLVQTGSHVFEDVPPPHSGTAEFLPVGQWVRQVGVLEVLRSALLMVTVFLALELWATFRIWPLQLLHVLMAVGYRPELRAALNARSEAIVAQPGTSWRRPVRDPVDA